MPPHDDAILPSKSSSQHCHPRSSMDGDIGMASSQEMSMEVQTQTQTQTEFLTQTQECCTQMADDDDDEISNLSPCAPLSPPPVQPWGRLMPISELNKTYNLMPRAPGVEGSDEDDDGIGGIQRRQHSPLNMRNISPGDIFNVHWIGRNAACDVTATLRMPANLKQTNNVEPSPATSSPAAASTASGVTPPSAAADSDPGGSSSLTKSAKKKKMEKAMHSWAHSMISNRHCRIYCALSEHANAVPTLPASQCSSGESPLPVGGFEVYVENMSSNGTLINQTILLKKGEKRLLHSGDEICLVNPNVLRKKVKSRRILDLLTQNYSYNFLLGQQYHRRDPSLPTMSGLSLYPMTAKRKQGCVNPRAMNYHSRPSQQSPQLTAQPPSATAAASKGNNHRPLNSPSFRRFEAVYDMREVLGDGTSGQVRRAIHRQTGAAYAVKIIALRRHHQFVDSTQLEQEANILQSLDHPYIVKLVDVFVNPGIAMYLVMELLHGGDLFDRIIAKEHFTEVESRRVMRRLLAAVHHLHEQRNIVHRDLKPENILCVHRDNSIEVKLTDFGLAKAIDEDDGLKTFCGTPQYFAPEVLRRQNTVKGRGRYGKPADMWSLGVVLYVLISGTPPFSPMDETPVIEYPEYPWESIPMARDLVQKLLREDPKRRLSVRQACDHPWIMIEDGDTHAHPLDDPVLTSRKRLFASPSPKEDEAKSEGASLKLRTDGVDETQEVAAGFSSNAPSSMAQDEGDNGSIISKEDFAKSAIAETVCANNGHHRSGSLLVVPVVHSPATDRTSATEGKIQQSPHSSILKSDSMEVDAPSSETTKPRAVEASTPCRQQSSSLGDAADSADAVSNLPEVTPSDAAAGEPLPPSDRYPLAQVSLNQRCNKFREQVLSSNKAGKTCEVAPAPASDNEEAKVEGEDDDQETSQSSPILDASRQDARGPFGVTPTASNRRSQVQGMRVGLNASIQDDVDDDISRFTASDASESLHSFGSSSIGSPMVAECKKPDDSTDSDKSAPCPKRRLPMAAANNDGSNETTERPSKKAKRSNDKNISKNDKPQKVVRQTKLTAWVVKKKVSKASNKASTSTKTENE